MSGPMYHVTLQFGYDNGPKVDVTDKEVIKMITALRESIEQVKENENWEAEGYHQPADQPFFCTAASREAAEFVLQHLTRYVAPTGEMTLDHYPEANEKCPWLLKEILQLGEYFGVEGFQTCIAFVIGEKIKDFSCEQIKEYMGIVAANTPDEYDPNIEMWHLSSKKAADEAAANGNGEGNAAN